MGTTAEKDKHATTATTSACSVRMYVRSRGAVAVGLSIALRSFSAILCLAAALALTACGGSDDSADSSRSLDDVLAADRRPERRRAYS